MTATDLATFFARDADTVLADSEHGAALEALLCGLEAGTLRAASISDDDQVEVHAWVKKAILIGFRASSIIPMEGGVAPAFDKALYPARRFALEDKVRVVPGGSSVRRGAYVAPGVVIMPPAYVNVGAYVDTGTMVDSHALVGSCAQIGRGVHLSAAAQIGGVLEPAGAAPVIVEDEAFIGGLTGVFEGVRVRARAVLAPGVHLTASTTIEDLVHGGQHQGEVPEGAVVVPGSRPAKGDRGLQLYTPVIVKYRDGKTDAATALESALR